MVGSCRICLSVIEQLEGMNIFLKLVDNKSAIEIIKECFSIQMLEKEDLGKYICQQCVNTLNLLYSFRNLILKNNLLLKEESITGNGPSEMILRHDVQNTISDTILKQECETENCHAKEVKKNENELLQDPSLKNCEEEFAVKEGTNVNDQGFKARKGSYKCDLCGKILKAAGTLRLHLMNHVGQKPFSCEFCGRGFTNTGALSIHKRIHTGDQPYSCDQCGKKFTSLSGLIQHRTVHATGEKPFHCKICNVGFHFLYKLRDHERNHTEERSFMCEICSKMYTSKGVLVKHLKNTHKSQDVKLPCPKCGKTFKNQISLQRHVRRHEGLKPFECTECGQKFTLNSSLKTHKVIHSGIKPYKCKVCEKSFSQSSILSRHMLIHSGEKPFSCTLCSMDFTYKHHLQGHLRKRHKEEAIESTDACGNMQTNKDD